MEELAKLAARLGAALRAGGAEADRLLLLEASGHLFAFFAALLIPLGILYFAARRRDFEFRGLLWLFSLAGAATALSHGLALWGMWQPDRWLQGTVAATASLFTFGGALVLWMQLPDALRMPSPRQLRRANVSLTRESWEQQRALQEAQAEAALLQGLVEHAALGTALVSAAGHWLHMNERFAEAIGQPRAELLKQSPKAVLGETLLASEAGSEERQRRVDGEERCYRFRTTRLRGADSRHGARLVQCEDLTAERRSTAELGRLREAAQARSTEASQAAVQVEQSLGEHRRLEAALAERAARLGRSAAQLEHLGARLAALVGHDAVTGLLSSHALAGRLDHALTVGRRYARDFSVLVVALDPVEEPGVSAETLAGILGSVVKAELREADAAARLDEDRIGIVLPETGAVAATRVADRIRRRLATTPFAAGGRTLRLTCCVGAAQWGSGQGLGELLGEAATALRAARASGRNRSAASSEQRGART